MLFLNYMPRKYCKEMARLESIFGQEYKGYASYTRSLLPRLRPYSKARKRSWRFDLFWKENREQYFLLGRIMFFTCDRPVFLLLISVRELDSSGGLHLR
jgi:hypothetical protein